MMSDWLSELRIKTLLLSFTNCAVGCALGFYYGVVSLYTVAAAVLILATGVLLQILSNFADDYGDALKEADSEKRIGPIRAVMIGSISLTQLRKAMGTVTVAATICGMIALYMCLGHDLQALSWFVFLGVLAILAAIFYTIGFAYGYKGFGDIAVFIFFGLAAVIGSQLLVLGASGQPVDIFPDSIYLACAIGIHSVMILHISAMRDIDEDRTTGKKTVAARLGHRLSALYLAVMFVVSSMLSIGACLTSHKLWECSILAVALIPLLASTYRAFIHCMDGNKVAKERKYSLIGIAIHNVAWIIILVIDFWFYY
ncbi:MAG: 1,4-dihydroxy-2-naphthoate octaprenyltransferase [Succinivibrio dextrinosolvens]|nr:1,4-dihydroxy-2-naphthoate octaprenyltransferase [Succinivibrio dextrinosolvens]MDY6419849.1 1,4-dihydroxy-2-naphthoate octaprenyltransferase [Succinivibrio dextrinosolvens]MDY6471128.1 1,4-dihydroxy-2-naphthoate octaprenyltransferase [Succinivibrio dextrinosolvens]